MFSTPMVIVAAEALNRGSALRRRAGSGSLDRSDLGGGLGACDR